MREDIANIIKENKIRNEILFPKYDPLTGEGSPIKRFKFKVSNDSYIMIPKSMLAIPQINDIVKKGGLHKIKATQKQIDNFYVELYKLRFKHDFEYWAYLCIKILDKKTKKYINFRLRAAQRKLLSKLEELRHNKAPIRIILLKARQWGGSTLVQIYMMWIQTQHKQNWHSVIGTDVQSQANNIRSMYKEACSRYPKNIGKLTMKPFEGGVARQITERGCRIYLGSMQNPDSLRSGDYAMAHFCLHPDTKIITKNGFIKKAIDIQEGDTVITHNGNLTKVTNVTVSKPNEINGNGKALSIQTWGGDKTVITPNHKIFTQRGWIEAGNTTKDDFLTLPVRKITNKITEIQLPYIPNKRPQGGGTTCKFNGGKIKTDREFGYFVGYYLAEGYARYKVNESTSIVFTRHEKEKAFSDRAVERVKDIVKSWSESRNKGTKTIHVNLHSTVLAKYFAETFKTKEHKTIPDWVFDCGKEFLTGILEGYLSGDGSKNIYNQNGNTSTAVFATSISSSIINQIRDISISLGYGCPSIYFRDKGFWYGRNCKASQTLAWSGENARNLRQLLNLPFPDNGHKYTEKSFIKDDKVWIKIKNITETNVEQVVDIEVEHLEHSFRTQSFSVKNSEVAIWKTTDNKKPEDVISSVSSSILSDEYTIIVEESTAKGEGNYFHSKWTSSVKGENGFVPVFVAWFEIEIYQKQFKTEEDKIHFAENLSTKAKYLWDMGATLEGINWYFEKQYLEKLQDWQMQEEYPSTAEEAFITSGERVIPLNYIQKAQATIRKPIAIGNILADGQKGKEAFINIRFEANDATGKAKIWAFPDKENQYTHRYIVIMDIGGRSAKADKTVIRVIDRYWRAFEGVDEMVFTWRGNIDADLGVWIGAMVAKWYDNALLVVESNTIDSRHQHTEGDHTYTVFDEIAEFYKNLYVREDPQKTKEGLEPKYGFHTNQSTKTAIINNLIAAYRDEEFIEHDQEMITESNQYEYKEDRTMGAKEGCHDDVLMTTAIGLFISKKQPIPSLKTKSITAVHVSSIV